MMATKHWATVRLCLAPSVMAWGIPVPGDPSQVIYVWWDALTNYITALGVDQGSDAYQYWWCGDGERVHVIGKGITRFHAVYWIGLLLSAGQPLPTTIHVHDYVNAGGAKLSKSTGNVVDPVELGLAVVPPEALKGGDAAANAA